jgi:hypothetical protein
MRLLEDLQRRYGRFGVPHITEGLIACQAGAYVMARSQPALLESIVLVPRRVLEGEAWRLVTFLAVPPPMSLLFALCFWYFFYLMGTALESTWGTLRYNLYLLVGWLATAAVSFLQPDTQASIGFVQGSVFLAFAYLYPNFQILVFLVLPVRIGWLALLVWIGYAFSIMVGGIMTQLLVMASILNFLLFFWRDIFLRMKTGQRRMTEQVYRVREVVAPRHACTVCGATSLTNPALSFRYCSKCAGGRCYCEQHIHTHPHILAMPPENELEIPPIDAL